jgi:SpoIID/LytB domain protein
VASQPRGQKWVAGHSNGNLILRDNANTTRYVDSSAPTFLRAQLGTGSSARRVQLDRKHNWVYRWGALEIRKPLSGYNGIRATVDFGNDFEKYVYGIAEVPFSWPQHSLRAQAVAARSYAVARSMSLRSICDCILTDGPENQVYQAANKELDPTYGQNWRTAVDATAGRVLTYDGSPIATFYSSSHNKRSENVQDVWSTPQPYHRSVNDPYSGTSANPFRSWTVAPGNATLANRVSGVSLVTYVRVLERTAGGTPTVLEVHGRDGAGNRVVKELRSSNKNIGLDLKSWYALRSAQVDRLSFSTFTDVHAHR